MQNKLYVIGMGPGSDQNMTLAAIEALEESQVIVGYEVYTALLKQRFAEKEYLETPMKQEKKRVDMAIASAASGKVTAMVSSGDSGVYGMASLVFTQLGNRTDVEVVVIAGVTAALSGGAILGAPLGHDFAVISLSDLLTPWERIEKRLKMAAMGDFCICLYNPSSKKRADYLQKACDIVLQYQSGDTVCGLVRNIGRTGESMELLSLRALRNSQTDMFTTVFIGNSQTIRIGERMVTPRGYENA